MSFKIQASSLKRLLSIFVFASLVVFLGSVVVHVISSYKNVPKKVRITNVASRSVTVSWLTDKPDIGVVVFGENQEDLKYSSLFANKALIYTYQKDGKTRWKAPAFWGDDKHVAYDDRDVADARALFLDGVKSQNQDNVNSEQYYQDVQANYENPEVVVHKKYYTHHVTIRNLDPEKQYYFKVGNMYRLFSIEDADQYVTDEELPVAKDFAFKTAEVREEILTPNPAFGRVVTMHKDEDGNFVDNPAVDSFVLVYGEAKNPDGTIVKTDIQSAVTNSYGSWSIDKSNFRIVEGEGSIRDFKNDINTLLYVSPYYGEDFWNEPTGYYWGLQDSPVEKVYFPEYRGDGFDLRSIKERLQSSVVGESYAYAGTLDDCADPSQRLANGCSFANCFCAASESIKTSKKIDYVNIKGVVGDCRPDSCKSNNNVDPVGICCANKDTGEIEWKTDKIFSQSGVHCPTGWKRVEKGGRKTLGKEECKGSVPPAFGQNPPAGGGETPPAEGDGETKKCFVTISKDGTLDFQWSGSIPSDANVIQELGDMTKENCNTALSKKYPSGEGSHVETCIATTGANPPKGAVRKSEDDDGNLIYCCPAGQYLSADESECVKEGSSYSGGGTSGSGGESGETTVGDSCIATEGGKAPVGAIQTETDDDGNIVYCCPEGQTLSDDNSECVSDSSTSTNSCDGYVCCVGGSRGSASWVDSSRGCGESAAVDSSGKACAKLSCPSSSSGGPTAPASGGGGSSSYVLPNGRVCCKSSKGGFSVHYGRCEELNFDDGFSGLVTFSPVDVQECLNRNVSDKCELFDKMNQEGQPCSPECKNKFDTNHFECKKNKNGEFVLQRAAFAGASRYYLEQSESAKDMCREMIRKNKISKGECRVIKPDKGGEYVCDNCGSNFCDIDVIRGNVLEGGGARGPECVDIENLHNAKKYAYKIIRAEDTGDTSSLIPVAYAKDEQVRIDDNGYYTYFPAAGTYELTVEGQPLGYVVNADPKTPHFFYIERNGKKGFQAPKDMKKIKDNEDYPIKMKGLPVKIAKTTENFKIELKKGFNLVSFPYDLKYSANKPYMASDFLNAANKKKLNVKLITYFEGGKWAGGLAVDKWTDEANSKIQYKGKDFPLTFGRGYLVVANQDLVGVNGLTLPGKKVLSEVPIAYSAGWNLVGIHGYKQKFTASSLMDSISAIEGLTADNVTRWDTSKGRYDGLQKSEGIEYGFDYPILNNLGYFVRISKFSPKDSSSKTLIWAPGTKVHGLSGSNNIK